MLDIYFILCYIFCTGYDEDTGVTQAAQREIRNGEGILQNQAPLTTSEPSAQIADRARPVKRQ